MSRSKRLLSLLLALLMVFLVACSSKTSETGGETKETTAEGETTAEAPSDVEYVRELSIAGGNDLQTMDYVITSYAADNEYNTNFVDGLLENDRYGNYVPALAESYESNEDNTVWTFKIRPGVKWVTSNQEEYAELKAEDFVTGLRHAAEFESDVNWLLQGVVKGYSEYLQSDFSDEAWEKVGIKAVDDMTVEYTLELPVPFFEDYTTYNVLLPINREFLEGLGEGCKLGSPNSEDCLFGNTEPNTILYNGAYILQSYDEKSSIVITKNEAYWDIDNVFIDKITEIYDDGKDPYSIKAGYEAGTYSKLSMRPTWSDYEEIRKQYEEFVVPDVTNGSVFGIVFNYNRQNYTTTQYGTDETLAANTRAAIQNLNFRKAFQAAFDRVAYLSISAPENVAKESLRNINNFPEAARHSSGKSYDQLITEAYKELTGEDVNLADGNDPWLSKDKALEYIEAAKEEGIQFPVHLDVPVLETSDPLVKQANSLKQSVESNTDGQIIIELNLLPEDDLYNIAYYNQDPDQADYDFNTFAGWGPDYNDPQSFAQLLSVTEGSYMTNVGLGTVTENDKGELVQTNPEIKEKVGFNEYEKLYQAAKAETKDLDKRYELFAKADAFAVANRLYLPGQMQTRTEFVTKIEPLTGPYSLVGLAADKYKGKKIRTEPIPAEEYLQIRENWEKERAATAGK